MKHTLDEEHCDPFLGESDFWVRVEHLGRYLFAANYAKNHKIITSFDGACGTGYGAAVLSPWVKKVVAVDKSQDINARYERDNICFYSTDLNKSIEKEPFFDKYDLITCFETLEHLKNPQFTLEQFRAMLKPGGRLMLSIPRGKFEKIVDGKPRNPYHLHAISEDELDEIITLAGFLIEDRKYQARTNVLHRSDNFYKRNNNLSETQLREF